MLFSRLAYSPTICRFREDPIHKAIEQLQAQPYKARVNLPEFDALARLGPPRKVANSFIRSHCPSADWLPKTFSTSMVMATEKTGGRSRVSTAEKQNLQER
jgi:hypothetical protein